MTRSPIAICFAVWCGYVIGVCLVCGVGAIAAEVLVGEILATTVTAGTIAFSLRNFREAR